MVRPEGMGHHQTKAPLTKKSQPEALPEETVANLIFDMCSNYYTIRQCTYHSIQI